MISGCARSRDTGSSTCLRRSSNPGSTTAREASEGITRRYGSRRSIQFRPIAPASWRGSRAEFFLEMQKFLTAAGANQAAAAAEARAVKSIEVSVIIPFCQNTDQLRLAITSVLAQTHKNIEIIVVYDTPETDISEAIPSVLPDGFTFAHYCQHRRGAGPARNFAIKR